jgi:hypothetical protein
MANIVTRKDLAKGFSQNMAIVKLNGLTVIVSVVERKDSDNVRIYDNQCIEYADGLKAGKVRMLELEQEQMDEEGKEVVKDAVAGDTVIFSSGTLEVEAIYQEVDPKGRGIIAKLEDLTICVLYHKILGTKKAEQAQESEQVEESVEEAVQEPEQANAPVEEENPEEKPVAQCKQSKEEREEARLAKAIASVKLFEEFGFATVASTSSEGDIYFVDFKKNYYATACSCKGNAEYGYDCIHMLAFDRACDAIRPSFHEMYGIPKLPQSEMQAGMAYFAEQCKIAEALEAEAQARDAEQEREVTPALTIGAAMTWANEQIQADVRRENEAWEAQYASDPREVVVVDAEREARETAKAWREYHDMPY